MTEPPTAFLRADAQRNHAAILDAARAVFADQGPDAPLDAIARRAGVGIGTLYRRFADRETLTRAVARDLWMRTSREAQQALEEEPTAFRALVRYMHRALDLRIAAVMPVFADQAWMQQPEAMHLRNAGVETVQAIVRHAHAEGTLRPDAVYGDIVLLVIRLSRSLPGSFEADVERELAHRHLDLLIDGLRATTAPALPGPALDLQDLRRAGTRPTTEDTHHMPSANPDAGSDPT